MGASDQVDDISRLAISVAGFCVLGGTRYQLGWVAGYSLQAVNVVALGTLAHQTKSQTAWSWLGGTLFGLAAVEYLGSAVKVWQGLESLDMWVGIRGIHQATFALGVLTWAGKNCFVEKRGRVIDRQALASGDANELVHWCDLFGWKWGEEKLRQVNAELYTPPKSLKRLLDEGGQRWGGLVLKSYPDDLHEAAKQLGVRFWSNNEAMMATGIGLELKRQKLDISEFTGREPEECRALLREKVRWSGGYWRGMMVGLGAFVLFRVLNFAAYPRLAIVATGAGFVSAWAVGSEKVEGHFGPRTLAHDVAVKDAYGQARAIMLGLTVIGLGHQLCPWLIAPVLGFSLGGTIQEYMTHAYPERFAAVDKAYNTLKSRMSS